MFSTGYEDQFSIPILKSYSRVNPIAAEKIIDEMINEYLKQISHLASLGSDMGIALPLGPNGNISYTDYSSAMADQLKDFKNSISINKERIKNEGNGKGRFTNKEIQFNKERVEIIGLFDNQEEVTTKNGIICKRLKKGIGKLYPSLENKINIHLILKTKNRKVILSTREKGNPITEKGNSLQLDLTFAKQQLVIWKKGMDEAIQLMTKGEKWEFTIPSNLAFGAEGLQNVIGPNEDVIVEIELFDIL